MSVRKYTANDYESIQEIYAQSKLDELRFEARQFSLLPLAEDRKRLRALNESQIYVYDDGSVAGYGAVCGDEIRALFVVPGRRGEGIGKTLLEFLLLIVPENACLYVASTNHPAKQLYKNYGFVVVDEFETEYNRVPVFANKMVRQTTRANQS